MVVAVGETEVLPLVVLLPLHPPDAVHAVAFVLDQVRIEDWPDAMPVGLAEIETVGLGDGGPSVGNMTVGSRVFSRIAASGQPGCISIV